MYSYVVDGSCEFVVRLVELGGDYMVGVSMKGEDVSCRYLSSVEDAGDFGVIGRCIHNVIDKLSKGEELPGIQRGFVYE